MGLERKRERTISTYTQQLKKVLDDLLPEGPNEATLRHRVEPVLAEFCAEVEVSQAIHDEYMVARGKIADAVFDRLVMEFKRPGILSSLQTRAKAIEQLKEYVEGLAKKERRKRLAGVVSTERSSCLCDFAPAT